MIPAISLHDFDRSERNRKALRQEINQFSGNHNTSEMSIRAQEIWRQLDMMTSPLLSQRRQNDVGGRLTSNEADNHNHHQRSDSNGIGFVHV